MSPLKATYTDVDPVLPRVWDDLWKTHGDAIRAAQDAAIAAAADVADAMGGPS